MFRFVTHRRMNKEESERARNRGSIPNRGEPPWPVEVGCEKCKDTAGYRDVENGPQNGGQTENNQA